MIAMFITRALQNNVTRWILATTLLDYILLASMSQTDVSTVTYNQQLYASYSVFFLIICLTVNNCSHGMTSWMAWWVALSIGHWICDL